VSSAQVHVAMPATASPASASAGGFRPEIQGLRTVAAFLVAIYHVWFDRVSGGVDIFFVVSGFLITGSLVRQLQAGGIGFRAYGRRIVRRIVPAAYLVLTATLIGTLILVSRVDWVPVLREIVAAALYLSNVELAANAVDYLARDDAQSPVMHYWALSIQGQFYLAWPLVLGGLGWLAVRRGADVRRVVLVGLVVVFLASFTFAILLTAHDQTVAYFSTPARVWEFALGGILALTLHRLQLPRWLASTLAAASLLAILSMGALLDVARLFPGSVALIPTLGAALIIVAGANGVRGGAIGLLSTRPMVYLGDVSYAFFLWHWPVLVFTLRSLGSERLDATQGAAVLGVSLVLAILTTRYWEAPVRAFGQRRGQRGFARREIAAFLAVPILLLAGTAAFIGSTRIPDIEGQLSDEHPGAAVLLREPRPSLEDLHEPGQPLVPDPVAARQDRPAPYADDCHQNRHEDEILVCTYGQIGADTRIALVGGSHSTHWQPALDLIGRERGWEILNITKGACRFGLDLGLSGSCQRWNEALVPALEEAEVDAVFTTATSGSDFDRESVPEGFLAQWERLADAGIPVLAIRDNPWWGDPVPECVDAYGPNAPECLLDQAEAMAARPPWEWQEGLQVPDSVVFLDLTDYFCMEGTCPSAIGGVLVYRDSHHISVPYAQSLVPILDREMQAAASFLYSSR
jgi:peptidoglycan/LPS O-acetylase OafA/YrhL